MPTNVERRPTMACGEYAGPWVRVGKQLAEGSGFSGASVIESPSDGPHEDGTVLRQIEGLSHSWERIA